MGVLIGGELQSTLPFHIRGSFICLFLSYNPNGYLKFSRLNFYKKFQDFISF